MSNSRLVFLLHSIPLLMTIVFLINPIQAQAQPNSPEDSCFPVEPNSTTLMCTEGPEGAGPESNATSMNEGSSSSSSSTSEDSCFPVEPNSTTLMCTEGPEGAGPESDSTS